MNTPNKQAEIEKEAEECWNFHRSHNIMTSQPKGVMPVSQAKDLFNRAIKEGKAQALADVMKIIDEEIEEETLAVQNKIERLDWTIVKELKFIKAKLQSPNKSDAPTLFGNNSGDITKQVQTGSDISYSKWTIPQLKRLNKWALEIHTQVDMELKLRECRKLETRKQDKKQ